MARQSDLDLNAHEIVSAAVDIFEESGLDAVSMRSVSTRLGVSPVPLYSRVGNKDALVDAIAERVQMLGGISIAMAADVAEMTVIPRPPRGREEVPVQLSRLLAAHEMVILQVRRGAKKVSALGDEGTHDLLVSNVLRTHEMQVWILSEHLVSAPLTLAAR